jgi:hypothetical protein
MMRPFLSQVNRVNQVGVLPPKWRMTILAVGLCSALCLTLLAGPLLAQRDARVLHRNLSELVNDSATIVLGRVTSVKSEPHPQFQNIQTIVLTLQVAEVWKGQAGSTLTIRMFVNNPLDYKEKLGYSGDQDMLLMLTKVSDIGMCSPAGLEQGRFRVLTDAQGNRTLVNGMGNAGLMFRMDKTAPNLGKQLTDVSARQAVAQPRPGPIPFAQFKQIVETLVANP